MSVLRKPNLTSKASKIKQSHENAASTRSSHLTHKTATSNLTRLTNSPIMLSAQADNYKSNHSLNQTFTTALNQCSAHFKEKDGQEGKSIVSQGSQERKGMHMPHAIKSMLTPLRQSNKKQKQYSLEKSQNIKIKLGLAPQSSRKQAINLNKLNNTPNIKDQVDRSLQKQSNRVKPLPINIFSLNNQQQQNIDTNKGKSFGRCFRNILEFQEAKKKTQFVDIQLECYQELNIALKKKEQKKFTSFEEIFQESMSSKCRGNRKCKENYALNSINKAKMQKSKSNLLSTGIIEGRKDSFGFNSIVANQQNGSRVKIKEWVDDQSRSDKKKLKEKLISLKSKLTQMETTNQIMHCQSQRQINQQIGIQLLSTQEVMSSHQQICKTITNLQDKLNFSRQKQQNLASIKERVHLKIGQLHKQIDSLEKCILNSLDKQKSLPVAALFSFQQFEQNLKNQDKLIEIHIKQAFLNNNIVSLLHHLDSPGQSHHVCQEIENIELQVTQLIQQYQINLKNNSKILPLAPIQRNILSLIDEVKCIAQKTSPHNQFIQPCDFPQMNMRSSMIIHEQEQNDSCDLSSNLLLALNAMKTQKFK